MAVTSASPPRLIQATQPMPRIRILAKCVADIRSGSRGFFEMAWIIVTALWGKLLYRLPRRDSSRQSETNPGRRLEPAAR